MKKYNVYVTAEISVEISADSFDEAAKEGQGKVDKLISDYLPAEYIDGWVSGVYTNNKY